MRETGKLQSVPRKCYFAAVVNLVYRDFRLYVRVSFSTNVRSVSLHFRYHNRRTGRAFFSHVTAFTNVRNRGRLCVAERTMEVIPEEVLM